MNTVSDLKYKKDDISLLILAIGISIAPATSWRIWKIGPGEFILFFWCLFYILKTKKLIINKRYFLFWILFLTLIIIGTTVGLVTNTKGTQPGQILTWVYIMIVSLTLYSFTQSTSSRNVIVLMNLVIKFSTLFYGTIFLLTFQNKGMIFGALAWYGGLRFTGGALNPHQFSIFSIIMIYLALFLKDLSNNKRYSIFMIVFLFLGLRTESSTFYLSVFLGFVTLYISNKFKNVIHKRNKLIIFVLVLLIVIIIFHKNLYNILLSFIESDVNGRDRFKIFRTYFDIWDNSFIFGLGPGVHARNGLIEFHNSYIELIVMSGFSSIVLFLFMFKDIYKSFKNNPFFMSSLFSILVYGFSGFVFRRLVVWVFLSLFYGLSVKMKLNNSK